MTSSIEGSAAEKAGVPAPDDPRKPRWLHQLRPRSWWYAARRLAQNFLLHQCTDLAAGLTYYGVLALVPGLMAVMSLVGLTRQGTASAQLLIDLLAEVLPSSSLATIRAVMTSLQQSGTSAFTLAVGLIGALLSSGVYVACFSRAMNRIYEIDEGRPWWRLRPLQWLVALLNIVAVSVALLAIVLSGPLARSVARVVGLGSVSALVMEYGRWPLLFVVALVMIAVLYYAAPNVRQPHFRWLSPGAGIAVVTTLLASAGFSFYVANFGRYDRTYGTLAGVVVVLLWLWLGNLALLAGAEIDASIERVRELQAGMPAEETLQLPPRDTRASRRARRNRDRMIEEGRRLRHRGDDHSLYRGKKRRATHDR